MPEVLLEVPEVLGGRQYMFVQAQGVPSLWVFHTTKLNTTHTQWKTTRSNLKTANFPGWAFYKFLHFSTNAKFDNDGLIHQKVTFLQEAI